MPHEETKGSLPSKKLTTAHVHYESLERQPDDEGRSVRVYDADEVDERIEALQLELKNVAEQYTNYHDWAQDEIERLQALLQLETGALEQACAAPVDAPLTVQQARAALEPAAPALNEKVARLRALFDDRTKDFRRSHSEALFNEYERLQEELRGCSRELAIERRAAHRASNEPSPEHRQLMTFYGVESLQTLIDAQTRHIERLQAKLPKTRDEFPRTPREG